MRHAFLSLGLALTACSGSPGVDGGSGSMDAATDDAGTAAPDAATPTDASSELDASLPGLRETMAAEGLDTLDGRFEAVDLSMCCEMGRSCSGNNPSSPYLSFYLPRGPGQTAPNFDEASDGTSPGFRMRQDEAVVLVGRTPPDVRYFGFTPYLLERDYDGTRRVPFASLGETLNPETIRVEGGPEVYDRPFALVMTGNATTEARVRSALVASGVPDEAINLVTLDPSVVAFGLDEPADTLSLLARVALFADRAAGAAWVTDPGATLLRVTPSTPLAPDPLASPPARPKDATVDETRDGLPAALDRLEAAIRAAHPGDAVRSYPANEGTADPEACIETGAPCLGDNRDALHPSLGAEAFTILNRDSVYVIGVDHVATGKATYASASVYALSHLVGVAAVTSEDWSGSAERFLPGDPDASALFAWRVARDCAGDAYCLEVPTGTCPSGAGLLQLLTVVFRVYVEPGHATAPDPGLLVRERVLHVRAP